jgi:hypothetical protein
MASATPGPLYRNPHAPVSSRVDDLLKRMSLDDKIGQMTQAERGAVTPDQAAALKLGSLLSGGGSVPASNTPNGWADMVDSYQKAAVSTPLGIPTIYGVDAVHGHNNVYGATIFPHNIGLGAANNPRLVEKIGRATALEVAGTGPQWDFSPCLCVARDDRWAGLTNPSANPRATPSPTRRPSPVSRGAGSGRSRARCSRPRSTTSATEAPRTASTRATPRSANANCARSTCRRSARRSTAASAR